jgi:plasmid stabilization system protein ParE
MISLAFLPEAEEELDQVRSFIDTLGDEISQAFFTQFNEAADRIRLNPYLYAAESSASIRYAPIHQFKYSIVYVLKKETIYIIAVSHQHRRPGYWKNRLRNLP